MQTAVDVTPEIMNWVLQRMDTSKIKATILNDVKQWRIGAKKPTFNQIESLSKTTGIPIGYFFLQSPPVEDLSFLEYRTIDSIQLQDPSRNLIDTIQDMENIQNWMRDYLIENGNAKLDLIASQKQENDAISIANRIRKDLELSSDWYTNSQSAWDSFKKIRALAEYSGIMVMMNGIVGCNTRRKLEIKEFRAFTLIDDYAPLIFINSNDSKNAELFSLLHEMAHIWLGYNSLYNDLYSTTNINKVETLCNAIAGELLVPQDSFIVQWKNISERDIKVKIKNLAFYYKCGTTVLARKALINDYISNEQYSELVQDAIKNYNEIKAKDKSGGGDFYKTMATRIDHRFFRALANTVKEGKTLYTDAFQLTHTNRQTFNNLIEKVRGASDE